jgi:ParB-like chromosome segregation protein Spo0J
MELTPDERGRLEVVLAEMFSSRTETAQQVAALNEVREAVAEFSPFQTEPVDFVSWVPADAVQANDYNPNSVAPPEMELLHLSIAADGYTQPIVANTEGDHWEVIDGFHRHRVGKEFADVAERVRGYLPVVQIRGERGERPDRMASTIRHNRARGKHQVIAMSEIVLDLKRRNWSDEKISRELGMDPDEVLRLTQITGLAEAFKDRDFSEAWEADLGIGDELDGAEVDTLESAEL